MITITLPDNSKREYPEGIDILGVAKDIGSRLAKSAVAGKIKSDGKEEIVDLRTRLNQDVELAILTFEDKEGRHVYRHTASHILAQAVKRLWPDAKLAIGPAIEDGFYYDFDVKKPFTPEDLEAIEKEMAKIIQEDHPVTRSELVLDAAIKFENEKNEQYKVELIEGLEEGEIISFYSQGEFTDLCEGPHLPSTGRVKAFKLLSVAGAYWRGDETKPMLQRIYGTAYDDNKSLQEHIERLEEAKRRDHRKLGKELDLFSIHEEGGPGLIYWHPKGGLVRQLIEDFWRSEHRKRGYDIVYSPHIAKVDLWKTSGHWDWYKDDMYSTIDIDGVEYMLKPMNCPFHILMYQTRTRSYRDLPLRWGELGTVYRYERSGVLHGLLRVRGFTQDDAHIFCRPDQVDQELKGVVQLAQFMMESFGYSEYEIHLSVRDPENQEKYIGESAIWESAEKALALALDDLGLPYHVDEGEAKFYGPAIDIKVKDALGRGWQGPTIQLDFNLPERFDITYIGEDGQEHRPVMIHRTVLGSMERFLGGLVEHYAGAFPSWLAPVQVKILPITDRQHDYAFEVAELLKSKGIRVEVDDRSEKIGYKIRQGETEKIPYMLVVGDRELQNGQVAVRARRVGDLGSQGVQEFSEKLLEEIQKRSVGYESIIDGG